MRKRQKVLTLLLSVSMVAGNVTGVMAQTIGTAEQQGSNMNVTMNELEANVEGDTETTQVSENDSSKEVETDSEAVENECTNEGWLTAASFTDPAFGEAVISMFDQNEEEEEENGEEKSLSPEEILDAKVIDIYCGDDKITSLDGIEQLPALETIFISNADLGSVDLSGNTKLTEVQVDDCNISSINVKGLAKLQKLSVAYNKLQTIEFAGNDNLESLNIYGHYNYFEGSYTYNHINELDLSGCSNLINLDARAIGLEQIDLSKNIKLKELQLSDNHLRSLDVSNHTVLQNLDLICNEDEDKMTELKVYGCSSLKQLNLSNTDLSSLDLSGCTSLEELSCYSQPNLKNLNLSTCPNLKRAELFSDALESIDVSTCFNLEELYLSNNKLETLNVKNLSKLTQLNIANNKLSSLDVSGTSLVELNCGGMKTLSNLNIKNVSTLTCLDCEDIGITSLSLEGCTALERVYASETPLQTLDTSDALLLEDLFVSACELGSLDVSKNTKLIQLYCDRNNMTSLNLGTGLSDLEALSCSDNKLSSLDITGCPSLRTCNASNNLLPEIVTEHSKTNLISLKCYNNKITKLDLRENTQLNTLLAGDNCLPALNLSTNTLLSNANKNKFDIQVQHYETEYQLNEDTKKYDVIIKNDEKNSPFDYTKVKNISCTDATCNEYGFTFTDESKIPAYFTYDYDTGNKSTGDLRVTVTVNNVSLLVNLWYSNTCEHISRPENPYCYQTGSGPLVLKPAYKEGATFEKWIIWDYNGNPEDHEAITEITDELIKENLDDILSNYNALRLRAVFKPDVDEIVYGISDDNEDYDILNDMVLNGLYKNNNPLYTNPGETVILQDPVCPGYKFLGWYSNNSGGDKITQLVTSDDLTYQNYYYVFAKWVKDSGAGDEPGSDTPGADKPGADTPGGTTTPGTTVPGGTTTPGTTVPGGSQTTSANVQVGEKVQDEASSATYIVSSTNEKGGTVTFKSTSKKTKKVKVPNTVDINGKTYKVTKVSKGAFKKDKIVTSVTIGNNVTTIEASAFEGCTKLNSVTVGSNVKTIGKKAFYNCKKLNNIVIKSQKLTTKTVGSSAFKNTASKANVKVPKKVLKAYIKLLQSKGLSKKATVKK